MDCNALKSDRLSAFQRELICSGGTADRGDWKSVYDQRLVLGNVQWCVSPIEAKNFRFSRSITTMKPWVTQRLQLRHIDSLLSWYDLSWTILRSRRIIQTRAAIRSSPCIQPASPEGQHLSITIQTWTRMFYVDQQPLGAADRILQNPSKICAYRRDWMA